MYKILIAEHDRTVLEQLLRSIRFEELSLTVCASAKSADDVMEKVRQMHPDVVLYDFYLPDRDGISFLRSLRQELPRCPLVLFISKDLQVEQLLQAIRMGARGWITNPLNPGEVRISLEDLLPELLERETDIDREETLSKTRDFLRLYHAGNGERQPFSQYMILHSILIGPESGSNFRRVCEIIEPMLTGDKAAFLRSRGSIVSYLFNRKCLEKYQGSLLLFARHLNHLLKAAGCTCGLLFDDLLFSCGERTLREDYDSHLYSMLTELFWDRSRTIVISSELPASVKQDLQDDGCSRLYEALQSMNLQDLETGFEELVKRAETNHWSIVRIQEINYRVYYRLDEFLRTAFGESVRSAVTPLVWQDAPYLFDAASWKSQLWEQIKKVYDLFEKLQEARPMQQNDRILRWMQAHFREDLSMDDVAGALGMSPSALRRNVQKATGLGYREYLNQLRMNEAKKLLETTDLLVYEIAEQSGFRESKTFVSKFTEENGVSPLTYRKDALDKMPQ